MQILISTRASVRRLNWILVPLVGGMLKSTARGFSAMNEALKTRVEGRVERPAVTP